MYLFLLVLLRRLIPLAAERVDTPVAARDIMRVKIIEIPPQASEQILTRFEQHVHLIAEPVLQEIDVLLHIPRAVSGRDDGYLGLKEERERLFPLMG